jgi:thioredoxin-like negative regulator of GroEL
MPLRRISSADAIEHLRHNLFASYPSRENPETNRIEPVCTPAFAPTFRLDYSDQIFTIGSCFARNIEIALTARGFDVATSRLAWPDSSIEATGNDVLNSYGVTSIENELRWALDPEHPFDPDVNLLEILPGRFADPNIRSIRPSPLDTMLAYRKAITDVTRRVRDCRIVVMTLGLSEVWYDTVAHTYLNISPPRQFMAKAPDRFELHVLDFAETLQALRGVISLLKAHCREDQRVLLTVSPVPLSATYTDGDVLVANCYSKSLLRTAAEHIAAEHGHIDYFPSYESVTLSDRSSAWEDDQVHVRRRLIAANVDRMIEAYEPRASQVDLPAIAGALKDAEEEIEARNIHAAIRILEPLRDSVHLDARAATLYADLCLRVDRPGDAIRVMAKLPAGEGGWRRELLEARAAILDGRTTEGISALCALLERFPQAAPVHRVLADTYCQLEQWDDALAAAIAWNRCKGVAKNPDSFAQIARIHEARGDASSAERAYRAAMTTIQRRSSINLDFVEFLIGQQRFSEAAAMLQATTPESRATQFRYGHLQALLPTAPGKGT